MTPPHPAPRSGAVPVRATIAALAFLGILTSATQSLIFPVLGMLGPILGTTDENAAWAATVTPLAAAVFVPVAGRLADQFGTYPMVLVTGIPLVLGSVLCALAPSLPLMLVGRVLQGASVALIPLGISLLFQVLPASKVGLAASIMSASLGIGGALGLPTAATIAQFLHWRVAFWTFAVLGVVGMLAVARLVPSDRADARARATGPVRVDVVGAVLLAAGLVCLLLPISRGATWGWTSPVTLSMLVSAVVVFAVWTRLELRHPSPIADLRMLARPTVLRTNVASLLIMLSTFVIFITFPRLMQLPAETGHGLGQSMVAMGLWSVPGGLAMLAVAPVTPRLSDRFGPRRVLILACSITGLSFLATLALMGHPATFTLGSVLIHAGTGMALGISPVLLNRVVPRHQTGSANGFNVLMRNIGNALAATVVGAVLATMTVVAPDGGIPVPSVDGFRTVLLFSAVVAGLAAAVAASIPRSEAVSR